jgi:hypothetical protein
MKTRYEAPASFTLIGRAVTCFALMVGFVVAVVLVTVFPGGGVPLAVGWCLVNGGGAIWYIRRAWRAMDDELRDQYDGGSGEQR